MEFKQRLLSGGGGGGDWPGESEGIRWKCGPPTMSRFLSGPLRKAKGGSRAVSDAAEVSAVFAQCVAADGTGYFGNQR